MSSVAFFGLIFTELGLGAAVVTNQDLNSAKLSTAFWLNASGGIILTLLVAVLSYPLGLLYGDMRLVPLLLISSLTFLFSLGTVQSALLERGLAFRHLFFAEMLGAIAGQTAAVVLALANAGAFSLAVIGPLTALVTTASVWFFVPWMPLRTMHRNDAQDLWRFSKHLLAFNAVNYWSRNLDNLALARVETAAVVGLYARAYSLMLLPLQQISAVITRVLLPVLARSRDSISLGRGWAAASKLSWVLGLPVSVATIVASKDILLVILGDQWTAAGQLVAVLALAVPPQLVTRTSGSCYQALSRTDVQLRVGLLCTGLTVIGILVGLLWGAIGVALGVTVSYYLHGLVVALDLSRRVGFSRAQYARQLLPGLIAAVAAGGTGWILHGHLQGESAILRLLITGLAVFGSYGAVVMLLDGKWILATAKRRLALGSPAQQQSPQAGTSNHPST